MLYNQPHPLEVRVLSRRFGLPEGQALTRSIFEFYLKDDKLNDPMVAE